MIEEPVRTAQHLEAVEENAALDWGQERASLDEPVEERSEAGPLLDSEDINDLQSRWNTIQIEFVDEPYASVESAGALVAEAMGKIRQALAEKQRALDVRWANREDVTTEDLRVTVQLYRSFFNQLLTL